MKSGNMYSAERKKEWHKLKLTRIAEIAYLLILMVGNMRLV
jgi:hypothetical protein